MKNLKIFLMATTMLLTLNVNTLTASALNATDICTTPLNGTFKLTINDVEYEIATPLNLSAVPVKVQIIDAGSIVFECTAQEFLRIHSDSIEHRIHSDSIEHRSQTIKVSQGGVLLFEKQL